MKFQGGETNCVSKHSPQNSAVVVTSR